MLPSLPTHLNCVFGRCVGFEPACDLLIELNKYRPVHIWHCKVRSVQNVLTSLLNPRSTPSKQAAATMTDRNGDLGTIGSLFGSKGEDSGPKEIPIEHLDYDYVRATTPSRLGWLGL